MRRIDAHRPRHHQVKVDEGHRAGLPGADIVRLDGPVGIGRDDLADLVEQLGLHRHVHQADDALLDQLPARPQDGDANQRRKDCVELHEAGRRRQQYADQHAQCRDDVGPQVPAVGDQRGRLFLAAAARQPPGPAGIDAGRQHADAQPQRIEGELARRDEAVIGLAEDQQRRYGDEDADHHGRKILGLVVAIGQAGVRRARGEPHRDQRHDRRHHVDHAFERV